MPQIPLGSFSLDVPVGWALTTLILTGPVDEESGTDGPERFPSKPFQQNLVATIEQVERSENAKSYVQRQIDGLSKAGVSRSEKAAPEEVSLPGGVFGLLTEQLIVGLGGERVRQLQLVTIKNRVAYTLIASHQDGEPFEESRQDLKKMLLSFNWTS